MKKKLTLYIIALMALLSLGTYAQDYYVSTTDAGVVQVSGSVDSVKIEGDALNFYQDNAALKSLLLANVRNIKFAPTPVPYPNGIPHEPGIVEAEDFDNGGEGISFHEIDGNIDRRGYRTGDDEQVDLYPADEGWAIGRNGAGEWVNYTINAPTAGMYVFSFWIGSDAAKVIDILIDGENKGTINVPNTSWAVKKLTQTAEIELPAGVHVVTIQFTTDGPTFDKFEFKKRSIGFPDGVPHEPGIIEAEDFDLGGEGTAFHEIDGVINWVEYRTGDDAPVDLYVEGERVAIGNNGAGEWVNYTINAPTAGTYVFSFWIGSDAPKVIDILIDGENKGTINVPNTSWEVKKLTQTAEIELPAGVHVVTILFTTDGPTFDKFEFVKQ
ncbi:hypothetical protein FACS189413_17370 [Bacteroidia bacterium]|nr:hypothetical protein FACS189413_17370 [Bacteroidia bacterium]